MKRQNKITILQIKLKTEHNISNSVKSTITSLKDNESISLLRYCMSDYNVIGELCDRAIVLCMKDMFEFAHAFTQAKRNMQEDICMWPNDRPRPGPRSPRSGCKCQLDTLIPKLVQTGQFQSPSGKQQLIYSANGAFI